MSETTILLADDSSTVRTMISRVLCEAGFRVVAARDGREAIDLAKRELPVLAVLDIVMPELDGYGVVEQLKGMGEPFCRLPIVFLTCVDSKALELLGDEYGAYLRKPVKPDELLAVIREHLPRNQLNSSLA